MPPIEGIAVLYILILAGFAGHQIIGKTSSEDHRILLAGLNFVNAMVLVGAMMLMGQAQSSLQMNLGFIAVLLASANGVCGFLATLRSINNTQESSGEKEA